MAADRDERHAGWQARVPADVDRPDTLLFGLTGRQVGWLAGTGLVLWTGWMLLHTLVPAMLLLAAAVAAAGAAFAVAVGRRDGIGLDRWLAAAVRHARAPHRLVAADAGQVPAAPDWIASSGPAATALPAPLRLPARGIDAEGTLDLGADGATCLAACSTLNFTLRTPREQDALIAAFAACLNSLEVPVQILIRGHRVDLGELAEATEAAAPGLPHPALEAAALGHARFLTRLATERDLRQRSVLLATHAPTPAAARAAREQVIAALAGCQITAVALDGPAATATLAGCADPYRPAPPAQAAGSAAPGQPVTHARDAGDDPAGPPGRGPDQGRDLPAPAEHDEDEEEPW